jgi:phage nucleotide-binding protein
MALEILSLDDAIGTSKPKIIIYADAGVGKTTLAGTLPGNVLILSAEDGLRSLKLFPAETRKRIRAIPVSSTNDLRECFERLDSGQIVADWVVLDSISEIAEIVLNEYKAKDKDPRQSYGKVDDDVMDILRSFRKLDCGVIFLAKEHCIKRQVSEGVEVDYYGILVPGKVLATKVPHITDEVWRLTVKNGRRVILTRNDARSRAKSRGGLDAVEDVDNGIGEVIAKLEADG